MFNNKKDPLVDAVKKIMEQNEKEREALKIVNEAFGVHSKKALPHELHGKYDAMLEEAKKCMYEEGKDRKLSPKQEKLAAKAGDEDEIEAVDLAKLRKDKTLEEAKATEAQKEKVAKVMHKWKKGKEHIGKSDKTVPVTKKGQKQAVAIALSQAGLSKKKMDESFDALNEEIRNNLLEKLNSVYETYGEQAAQYAYDTLSEEERGILGEQGFLSSLFGPNYNKFSPTVRNYGAFGEPKTAPSPGAAAQAARANEFMRTKGSNTVTGSSTRFSSTGEVTREPTPSASGVTGQKPPISNRAAEMGNDSRRDISPSVTGEPSKDLETGVSPTTPAAKQAARPATAPKPAAPATSTDTGSPSGSFSQQPSWARDAFSGEGRGPSTPEPSTTRSVRQAPERKSSSSFSRATRGDFSGITGGGGA